MLNQDRIEESKTARGDKEVTTTSTDLVKKEKGFVVPKYINMGDLIGKTDIEEFMRNNERSPLSTRHNTKPLWFYNTPFGVPRGINPHSLRTLAASWIVQGCISVYQSDLRSMKYSIIAEDSNRAKEPIIIETAKIVTDRLEEINNDEESIQDLWEKWIKDILEIDAGVFVSHFVDSAYEDILSESGQVIQTYIPDDTPSAKVVEFTTEDGALFYKDFYEDGQLMGFWHHTYTRGEPRFFSKRQISYSMFNPATYSPYGWSKVQQLYDVLIAMISSVLNTSEYMARGAVPAGIIELNGADEDEANAFRDYWRKKVQGSPHKFAIVGSPEEGGIKFIPLNFSIEDITFLNGLDFFWRVVLATFHISPNEMGITSQINKSNSESQERVVTRNQKMPMFTKLERIMNLTFLPEITVNHHLVKFVWETPEDVEKLIKTEQIVNSRLVAGRRTINETRVEDGLDPFDDPRADVPQPFWDVATEGDDLGFNVADELSSLVEEINSMKRFTGMVKKDTDDLDVTISNNITNFAKIEELAIKTALNNAIGNWFGKVKEMVKNFMERNPDAKVDTVLLATVSRMTEPGSTVLVEIQSHLQANIAQVFERAFNTDDNLGEENPIFKVVPRTSIEFMKAHALLIADKLTSDLAMNVKQQLIMGMSVGESIPKLAGRIQEVLQSSKARAKTIARTETIRAMAHGQHTRMEQEGIEQWIFFAHLDDRVDSECRKLHGKTFSIDNIDKLPPIHPNCRCTLLAVVDEDDEEEETGEYQTVE